MTPPLLSYVTFNRLGLTIKNLSSILESTDDFEMHIVDNCSTDDTWKYLQSIKDRRVITKTQILVNHGQVYASNLNLAKRRPDQYFITVDNDVYIETKDWISRYMKIFNAFPEVGLLGLQRVYPYTDRLASVVPKARDGVVYHELQKNAPGEEQGYVPGCCQCLRPELLKEIGYWSEENCFGDAELTLRVMRYTTFKAGFVPDVSIRMPQRIECGECQYRNECGLYRMGKTCFMNYQALWKNDLFMKKYKWRFEEVFRDMDSGARPPYCASIHDQSSIANHVYNINWAIDNFRFYIDNAN